MGPHLTLNPGGPNGKDPDPLAAAKDIAVTFARMAYETTSKTWRRPVIAGATPLG